MIFSFSKKLQLIPILALGGISGLINGQDEKLDGKWTPLFDGKSTAGWTPRTEVEKFEAKEGELHLFTTKNCWVTTDLKMTDFEVELEVMLPDDARELNFNSGLAFRCTGDTGKPKGYQCEIDGADPGKSGGVYGIGLGGWLYPKKGEQQKEYSTRFTEAGGLDPKKWNKFRVVAEGPRIRTFMNGTLIADLTDSQSLGGYFGIQHHGKGGTVKFRNIRARKLLVAKKAPPTPKPSPKAGEKPNILWIVAEDMSPVLGCYGDEYATTPHIDKLATESVLYTNAFASAPVCSPSRSCLITGMYQQSMGTHQMRSAMPIPTGVVGFPKYFREAGYFTTNNVKTDYNTSDHDRIVAESWNKNGPDAHWRDRDNKDAPFFAIFNDMTSHQSRTMVWPYESFQKHIQSKLSATEIHDPKTAPVPPYYPDTEIIRRTVARAYDCVTLMDQNTGRYLAQLEEDGLADNTIVFFYSDHGSGMPRHKRLLHDSGMRVALMVRFPEKWKHLAPAEAGTRTDQPVSFVDFAPTVVSLAGLEIPDYMQGLPFLGPDAKKARKIVYGARDRVDEVHEMARSVRNGRYLYIRNYMPHLSLNQPSVFSDLGEIRKEINEIAATKFDTLTAAQKHYAGPTKAAEEFYDCKADPQNVKNLLGGEMNAEATANLAELRVAFKKMRIEILDSAPIPESVEQDYIRNEGAPFRDILLGKTNHKPDLEAAWEVADLVGLEKSADTFLKYLESSDPSQRYWAVIGLRNLDGKNADLQNQMVPYLDDIEPSVRIETAFWLAEYSDANRKAALAVLERDLTHDDWWSALRACRSIELLGEKAASLKPAMRKIYSETRNASGDPAFYLAFSSGAFLDQFEGEKTEPWAFTPDSKATSKLSGGAKDKKVEKE